MASYVDFAVNIEPKYISRLVDLPLYRSKDEQPIITEINCEPPRPQELYDSDSSSDQLEQKQIKKSVSCTSLSGHHHEHSTYNPFEATTHRPYETYHASNTLMDPLRVQKQKKKKGFLRNLFKKRKSKASQENVNN